MTEDEMKLALKITMNDCGKGTLPPDEHLTLVKMKISVMRKMMDEGFMPVNAFPDGRIIVAAKGREKTFYMQIHARQEGSEWMMCCYPVDSIEGTEMLSKAQQMERFANNNEIIKVQADVLFEDGECSCPNCMARRLSKTVDNHLEKTKEEHKNRVLH